MLVTLHPFGPPARPRYWNQPDEVTYVDVDESIPANSEAKQLSASAHALYISGLTEQALEYAQKAVALARIVPTLINNAVILEQMGRFREAFPLAKEAWRMAPYNRNATILYSQALLRRGNFADGWPLYIRECALWPEFSGVIKEWDGTQDLTGKRLLVVEGGAFGDNLYFMRWLKDLPAEITYVCQPSFAPLVRHLGFNAAENWSGNVDIKFIHYDYLTSVLALAGRLGVTLENYHYSPYIKFENKVLSSKIPPQRPLRVGICSLAGENSSPLRVRSMHDSQLHKVLNILPGRHLWVNLTYKHGMPLGIEHPSIDNWLQTAEAISKCDLVVTIDTGVAHLAGAMGVPTWVVLPGASAWQWLLDTETIPLYPTMKLFRNQGEGLDNAVEKLCDHLSRL